MANQSDLETQLESELIEALRARDEIKLQVLRLLKAALKNYSIEIKDDLSAQQVLQILQKEAKKRQDSINQFRDAGRDDLVEKETIELEVLKKYLPAEASVDDIQATIEEIIKRDELAGMASMGKLISGVKEKLPNATGEVVARLARQALA